jgi:hypothetical protein
MGNVNISGECLCWVCAPKAERERILQVLLTELGAELHRLNEDDLRKLLS